MSFDVEKKDWFKEALWVLSGPAGLRAEIVPGIGANLISLSLAAAEDEEAIPVLSSPPDAKSLREAPTRYGCPVLFPFPSRLAKGKFSYGGQDHQVDVYPDGNARHGFVTAAPFEFVAHGAGHDEAWATFAFDGNTEDILRQFPFPFGLVMTFRLRREGLFVDLEGENTGDRQMPMGFGWHPYFNMPLQPGGSRDNCRLVVPASKYWELSPFPDLVPTGNRIDLGEREDLASGRLIGAEMYDDMFTAVSRDEQGWTYAALIDDAANLKLSVGAGPTFREWVIYTPPERAAICLEPYTCAGNAFNLHTAGVDAGVQEVAPGSSWQDALSITLTTI